MSDCSAHAIMAPEPGAQQPMAVESRKGPSLPTTKLLALIREQRQREQSCMYVPCVLLPIVCTVLCGWLHAQSGTAALTEVSLLTNVLPGAVTAQATVSGPTDLYGWLQSSVLPVLQPSAHPSWHVLGGLRVSQWRAPAIACTLDTGLARSLGLAGLQSGACTAGDDTRPLLSGRWLEGSGDALSSLLTSSDAMGEGVGVSQAVLRQLNGTARRAVLCAFRRTVQGAGLASSIGTNASGSALSLSSALQAGYHALLPLPPLDSEAPVVLDALAEGAWLDSTRTASVRVQAVGINPTSGRWIAVAWDFHFTRAGAVLTGVHAASAPINPSLMAGETVTAAFLPLLDACAVLLALFLTLSGAWGCGRWCSHTVCSGKDEGGGGTGAWLAWALDVAAALALWTCLVQWNQTGSGLADTARLTERLAPALRTSVGSILAEPCFGDATSDPLTATLALHATLGAALDSLAGWRKAAGAATALLMLRALRTLALQPRLALLLQACQDAAPDLGHFGLLFSVLLVGHAAWAGIAFGSQAPDFGSLPAALFSLLRMAMFDYSLDPMLSQDGPGASVFYATFMLGVTHIVLWTWLGIALETYSAARNGARERPALPGLVQDVRSGWGHAPAVVRDLMAACGGETGKGQTAGESDQVVHKGDQRGVKRSHMLQLHDHVLSAVTRLSLDPQNVLSHSVMHARALSGSLGVSHAAACAIMRHYAEGDDCSDGARLAFAMACAGVVVSKEANGAILSAAASGGSTQGSTSSTSGTGDDPWDSVGHAQPHTQAKYLAVGGMMVRLPDTHNTSQQHGFTAE